MKNKKTEVLLDEDGRDELQKRLKKEQEKENMRIQRLTGKHPQIYSDGNNSRRLNSVQTVTEIRPYLLLCGALALRGNVLQDLEVTCVINATNELPDTPLPQSVKSDILYLRVSVDDRSDSDILSWLDMVSDLIHQVKLASGKTLIHCVAGISRSATLCLAYLIKYEGYTLYDSYNMIRQLRHIRPNSGFFGQLVEFEKRVTGKQTVLMIPNRYASTCIPHLYEDDYNRLYTYKWTAKMIKASMTGKQQTERENSTSARVTSSVLPFVSHTLRSKKFLRNCYETEVLTGQGELPFLPIRADDHRVRVPGQHCSETAETICGRNITSATGAGTYVRRRRKNKATPSPLFENR